MRFEDGMVLQRVQQGQRPRGLAWVSRNSRQTREERRVSGQREAVVHVGTPRPWKEFVLKLEEKGLSVLSIDVTWLHTITFLCLFSLQIGTFKQA